MIQKRNPLHTKSENNSHIPVVILCGGRGIRLKEETDFIPKPLVKISDWPILWHVMKIYSAYGFERFILPVGYKGEKIKEYFLNYSSLGVDFTIDLSAGENRIVKHTPIEEKWKITIVDTGPDAETGARIKRIEPYIEADTFMLTYCDGVSDVNIKSLLKFHKRQGKTATITGVHPPARFGEIVMKNKKAVNFWEKTQLNRGYINGGFFVLDRSIFNLFNDDEQLIFEKDILPMLVKKNQLSVFRHNGYWQCMDMLRDVDILKAQWATGNAPWKVWET